MVRKGSNYCTLPERAAGKLGPELLSCLKNGVHAAVVSALQDPL